VDARLLLSARTLEDVLYREELEGLAEGGEGTSPPVGLHITLTRADPPPGWHGFARRVDRDMLAEVGPPPSERPLVYVCGPTPFVEEAARLLVELGHEPARVHTERFGPTGG
jgi:ferredoxin-NADP reductase